MSTDRKKVSAVA